MMNLYLIKEKIMRKVLLMMVCVWMIGWAAKAQSGWSLTPEAGITAVQRV